MKNRLCLISEIISRQRFVSKRQNFFFSILLIIFSFTLVAWSCEENKPIVHEKTLNEKLNFSEAEFISAIKNAIEMIQVIPVLADTNFLFKDTIVQFYSSRNFSPKFLKSFEDRNFVYSLMMQLEQADAHGLEPNSYHTELIHHHFENAIDTNDNQSRYRDLAIAELLICDAVLKYSFHLRFGLYDPKKLFPDSYYLPSADSSMRELHEPLRQENILVYLSTIQPKSERYKKLQVALKKFKLLEKAEWKKIPQIDKKIEPLQSNSILPLIAEQLLRLGFIDSSHFHKHDNMIYDSLIVNGILKFQKHNGLQEDGIIGKGTIDKLNITPTEYIKKIKINLERFRWLDYSSLPRYIFINIPEFKLHIVENQVELSEIKVCTGIRRSAYYKSLYERYKRTGNFKLKPEDWETPEFNSVISSMILNPEWNVPPSIMREEIQRELKKDSSYLKKKKFKVYKDGKEINLDDIDIKEFGKSNIPYRIVQDPGVGNALGKVKFMFNNKFGIYLHDTPTRPPFNFAIRAVSHGCVRVEKPLVLAQFLLENHSQWNLDFFKIEIGERVADVGVKKEFSARRSALRKNRSFGPTTELVLEQNVPLYIEYFTAWVDKNGQINFREDVYRKDETLLNLMFPEKK